LEGRYTAGRDPVTGKVICKNVLGKTQAEVKEKLKTAIEKREIEAVTFADLPCCLWVTASIGCDFQISGNFIRPAWQEGKYCLHFTVYGI